MLAPTIRYEMRKQHHAVDTPLCVVTAVALVCVWHAVSVRYTRATSPRTRRVILASAIRATGAIAWPAVLTHIVPREDRTSKALVWSLAWNTGMWLLDATLMRWSPASAADDCATVRLDSSSLMSVTFGLCSLVGAARADSRHVDMYVCAVLGCVLVVMPRHNLEAGCVEEQIFESVQKAALMWCISLLVAAVALTRTTSAQKNS